MSHLPTLTYVLDGLGGFGIIVGGYVASRSVYTKENSSEAAKLINTLTQRVNFLENEIKRVDEERKECRTDIANLGGQLEVYKKMALVSPDIIQKLTTTLDNILNTLTKDGVHIDTQNVDKQVIRKSK